MQRYARSNRKGDRKDRKKAQKKESEVLKNRIYFGLLGRHCGRLLPNFLFNFFFGSSRQTTGSKGSKNNKTLSIFLSFSLSVSLSVSLSFFHWLTKEVDVYPHIKFFKDLKFLSIDFSPLYYSCSNVYPWLLTLLILW